MECPKCKSEISVWRMRYKRKCPSCGVLLKNGLSPRGYIIFVIFLAVAGTLDYYANVKVIFPLCNYSDICTFGWGSASTIVYILAVYVSAAMGAFRYSLSSRS
jgi:hypothetical protein